MFRPGRLTRLLRSAQVLHLQRIMLRHCLYCGNTLAVDPNLGGLREGVRVAYDPDRGRVWNVCDACHGWSLWPFEDRIDALDELEYRVFQRGRTLYATRNIALIEADGRELVRVGRPELPEEAWWRYGQQLRQRRVRYNSRLSMIGAASYAAVSYVGTSLGWSGIVGDFRLADDLHAEVVRWRRFGSTAWKGRLPCPQCNSVLIKLFYFKSRSLILLPGRMGDLAVGMPCSRCDPWTLDKVHRFEGRSAERVLRRVLAYHNVEGASEAEVRGAAAIIERAGSARSLVGELTKDRPSLHRLDRSRRLALEISINENAERRQLALESSALEARWRRAEELAAIIDEELE